MKFTNMMVHVALLSIFTPAVASTPAQTAATKNRYDALMAESGTHGVLVLIDGRRVLVEKGYGLADRQRRVPYDLDTVHDIGSLTKQFTAAAVVDLALRGKLDLQAPVKRYLPNAAEPVASVTVEQLLTHRSGMPEYCGDEQADATKSAMLARCMAAPLRFPAGTGWAYSNPGFSVLAMIVETVGGAPIDAYLKTRFFDPLSMKSTGYVVAQAHPAALGYDRGKVHVPFNGARAVDGHHWNIVGNGGMQSTGRDMIHWFKALSEPNTILPEALRLALTSPHVPRNALISDGYGWAFLLQPDGRVVSMSHSGSDGVFYSYFYWNRIRNRFFYFNSNAGEDQAVQTVRKLRALAASE